MTDAPTPPSGALSAAEQLAAVWTRFRDATLARVGVLEHAVLSLLDDALSPEERARAEREAHKLAGSSGTFGFARASRIAREIEQQFAGPSLTPASAVALSEQLLVLRSDLEGEPAPPQDDEPEILGALRPTVLILGGEPGYVERCVMEAEGRGLTAVVAASPAELSAIAPPVSPAAVLVSLTGAATDDAALDVLERLHGAPSSHAAPPAVAVAHTRFTDRVELARRGVLRVLEAPASPRASIDGVLEVLHAAEPAGGTVVWLAAAAPDDRVMRHLEQRRLRVNRVDDVPQLWRTLESTTPDAAVLSLDHPAALDVVRALRGADRWRRLPVVVLGVTGERDELLRVLAAGADECVAPPVDERELAARLERLTATARHAGETPGADETMGVPTRDESELVVGRLATIARAMSQPLAVGIVSLHGLDRVGPQHGSSVARAMMRTLGHLLSRAVAPKDFVGRWTESSFVVASYCSTKSETARAIDGALSALKTQSFDATDGTRIFGSATAGVAQLPADGVDLGELARRAQSAAESDATTPPGAARVVDRASQGEVLADAQRVDVVLVDDDEALIGLLRHSLESRGFSVHAFPDGERAVRGLTGAAPDIVARLIILDVDLPALSGHDVLRRLSRDGVTTRSKVLMLTGRNAEDDVLSGLGLGALDHINKPFSMQILLQKVARALSTTAS